MADAESVALLSADAVMECDPLSLALRLAVATAVSESVRDSVALLGEVAVDVSDAVTDFDWDLHAEIETVGVSDCENVREADCVDTNESVRLSPVREFVFDLESVSTLLLDLL